MWVATKKLGCNKIIQQQISAQLKGYYTAYYQFHETLFLFFSYGG